MSMTKVPRSARDVAGCSNVTQATLAWASGLLPTALWASPRCETTDMGKALRQAVARLLCDWQ
eukprot:6435456-Alexandrium_andersonii.AAC.1